ncbi:ABC transporter ATP-binding protein [Saccharibacillus sp. CPCC 101409]|uniref:ABC transporter ATP-binding protein n=1 Tax=Saccharibacillus sp. CPCC 101409 TaxID=3058041 RepID=UPI002670EA06|nr:ABC transporter ATP-binding protein [Saccharibacillus sp. CPCC 101409]MDO3410185.1 ABC transporter ATP-binding protein [Saccharibacillus sp. CPCC 101409]
MESIGHEKSANKKIERGGESGPEASAASERGIRLREIGLSYWNGKAEEEALHRIDLEIAPGEFVAVLGPSGCGKTSLLNVIAGYIRPSGGSVTINGRPHTAPDSEVGVVFQQPNLFPWLSLARNIEFGLRMKNRPKQERQARVAYFLDMMGLTSSGRRLPHQLSGGMKQRAAIARTLAAEPEIVLLDEPFSALDALTRENMQSHLREIWCQTGKCLFFITHDVDEALLLATRLIVMHPGPGRIVEDLSNPLAGSGSFEEIRSGREYAELRRWLIGRIGHHAG